MSVAVLVFGEVEVLDFAGPFEVFSVASRVALRDRVYPGPSFDVFVCPQSKDWVTARHGLSITPALSLNEMPRPDILIVPGRVVECVCTDDSVLRWIADAHLTTKVTASVCTGAFLLNRVGLLQGSRITTNWEDIDDLRQDAVTSTVVENVRYVDEGRIVTSAGVAAGFEMSLHLIGRLTTGSLANRTAKQIDFPFRG